MKKTIGERVRDRRIELNMSQDELAHKLGYKSRSSINKIETHCHNLPQKKIMQIATALETTPAYIMGWQEEIEAAQPVCDLLDILFKQEPEFLSKIKSIQLDGKLNEPGVAAKLTETQKETLRNIIKMTYNEAVRNGGQSETVVTEQ